MRDLSPSLLADAVALACFLVCWIGYTRFAKKRSATEVCLASVMHMYRVQWSRALLGRANRIADMSVIATFERNMAFFGSSSLIIVAGLLTLLGNVDAAIALFGTLPFATVQSTLQWEAKLALLVVIFVYAFFKFSWAMRQIGFAAILIGAAPETQLEQVSEQAQRDTSERIARVVSMAGHHFNFGIRSYYFALAVLAWFINPWIFVGATVLVVYVLYRREFKSSVLRTLMSNESY
jgi:uncharacterized membrane protein